jgi:hypothetical protein
MQKDERRQPMPRDLSEAVRTAISAGSVSKAAGAVLEKAMQAASDIDTGVPVADLRESRVFAVSALVDDSGSMRGFESEVIDAVQKLLSELEEAQREAPGTVILISISLLNRGLVQPFCRVSECRRLDREIYQPGGGTPLLGRFRELNGTLMTKVAEFAIDGRPVQSYTCVVSDGKPTDSIWHENGTPLDEIPEGTIRPEEIAELVRGMTQTKQHIVCGISIGGTATRVFEAMGIPRKWILDPDRDSMAFDAAIRQVSRASRSASRGAGAFQAAADSEGLAAATGGFR